MIWVNKNFITKFYYFCSPNFWFA